MENEEEEVGTRPDKPRESKLLTIVTRKGFMYNKIFFICGRGWSIGCKAAGGFQNFFINPKGKY